MKNIFNIILVLFTLTFSTEILAHEGHDHDGPAAVQAPKGGVIKSLEEVHVEVVAKGKDVKIYLYDETLKPADVANYKVTATAELPRNKKSEAISLKAQGKYFEATYDAKGAHRYTLVLTITDPKHKHEDKLNFTIEPRR